MGRPTPRPIRRGLSGYEYHRRVLINPEDSLSRGKLGYINSGSRMGRKAFLDSPKAKSMLMPKSCCIQGVAAMFVNLVSRLRWAASKSA